MIPHWIHLHCLHHSFVPAFVRLRNHLHPPKQKPRREQKLWLDEWLEGVFVKKRGKKRNWPQEMHFEMEVTSENGQFWPLMTHKVKSILMDVASRHAIL